MLRRMQAHVKIMLVCFFFSSRRRHTRCGRDWSSDVCSSDLGDEVYLVPRPSGELLVGATVERVGFQGAVTALGIAGLLSAAIELVPVLGGLPINRTWYGFRPWAPDNLPILGPWPGLEGLWIATAHFRNGILLAPITAKVMTEWILTGRPSLSLEDFLPDRFIMRREP